MPHHESMDGRYYRTCSDDIRASQGWFKNVLILGLVNVVPVFGQMSVLGYSYEWGHKAAWGVSSPLPDRIYGRKNSKMLRWGWFAIVIMLVFAVIPYILMALGGAIGGAASIPSLYDMYSHSYDSFARAGSVVGGIVGGVVEFIGWIAAVLCEVFAWAGIIRMTMYDRLGTGLQFGKVWKMATRDFGGLLRIFGMQLLVGFIMFIVVMALAGVLAIIGGMGAVMAYMGLLGLHGGGAGMGGTQFLMMLFAVFPLMLVAAYAASCMAVYLQLLVGRAVGYWCAQFDVADWGTKDDPLPFEREKARDEQTGEPESPESEERQEDAEDQGQTREAGPEDEEETGSAASDQASEGPIGWRAAGTSASDKGPGDAWTNSRS